jgi:hypothetical protein
VQPAYLFIFLFSIPRLRVQLSCRLHSSIVMAGQQNKPLDKLHAR